MNQYHAPANMTELTAADLILWNDAISTLFDSQIAYAQQIANPDAVRAWMFNPISAPGAEPAVKVIEWTAFPKKVSDSGVPAAQGWALVDSNRDAQEEYCEWEVARNEAGKVVRVTFTCETEDYYRFLASNRQDLLLELYGKHVSPQVKIADLLIDGEYNPQNRWNYPKTGGARGLIMHMGQENNTFGAAVNLAAVATWPRVDPAGKAIVGEQELISCAKFGDKRRHSDPHIGAEINALVRAGHEIGFADPVGLYIHSIDQSDWDLPVANLTPKDLMRVVRGSEDQMLRVIFEAPAESGMVLGDASISGVKINFGSQIAEKIQVRLTGIARPALEPAPALRCDGAQPQDPKNASDLTFSQMSDPVARRMRSSFSVLSPE